MSQKFEIFNGRAQVTLSPEEAHLLQLLHALEEKGLLMGEDDLQSYDGAETRFPGTLTVKGRAAAKASLYAQVAEADKSAVKPGATETAGVSLEDENALLRKALEPFASLAGTLLDPDMGLGNPAWVGTGGERICDWLGPTDFARAMAVFEGKFEWLEDMS